MVSWLLQMDFMGILINKEKLKEVALLSQLKHKNLIRLHDYFTENGNIYLVTEYWEKGDLAQCLSAAVWLSPNKIWKFVIEIMLALAYLHESDVIHWDIKPQNIFVSSDNKVKVGDLSSAMIGNKSNHFSLNFGTPSYTPPEIYNQDTYDKKADIWSFGCVIYELCTGRKAFDSSSIETLKTKITDGSPPQLVFASNK